jgi:hypothetical protein
MNKQITNEFHRTLQRDKNYSTSHSIDPVEIAAKNVLAGFFGILVGLVAGVISVPGIPILIITSPIIAHTYYTCNRVAIINEPNTDSTETNTDSTETNTSPIIAHTYYTCNRVAIINEPNTDSTETNTDSVKMQ